MKVYPTEDKIRKGLEMLRENRAKGSMSIRQLAGMIGVLTDLTKGCEYGMGHYRFLEKDKTLALRRAKGDYEGETMKGRFPCRKTLNWILTG